MLKARCRRYGGVDAPWKIAMVNLIVQLIPKQEEQDYVIT